MIIKSSAIKQTKFPCLDDEKQLQDVKGGRIVCEHCYSMSGAKIRRYRVKGVPRISITCVACGANEKRDNHTGEILSQTVDMLLVDKYKTNFMKEYPQKNKISV